MNEDCLKLTTYFGERQRSGDRFVAEAMLDLFGEREIASSIMLRGIAGFGLRHHLRTDQTLSMSEDPPVAVIAVDTKTKIDEVLDPLLAIKKRGLLTLERARLLRDEIDPIEIPEELHEATKLSVYVGRKELVYGVPAYLAHLRPGLPPQICRRIGVPRRRRHRPRENANAPASSTVTPMCPSWSSPSAAASRLRVCFLNWAA